jgi:hypothetical protein
MARLSTVVFSDGADLSLLSSLKPHSKRLGFPGGLEVNEICDQGHAQHKKSIHNGGNMERKLRPFGISVHSLQKSIVLGYSSIFVSLLSGANWPIGASAARQLIPFNMIQ